MPRSDGSETVPTPAVFLRAARACSGWALAGHHTARDSDGTLRIVITMAHRGGIVVSHAPFRRVPGYEVVTVESFVLNSKARVFLTARRANR